MLSKEKGVMLESILEQLNRLGVDPRVNLSHWPFIWFNRAVVNICQYVDDSNVVLAQVFSEILVVLTKVCAWYCASRIVAPIDKKGQVLDAQ